MFRIIFDSVSDNLFLERGAEEIVQWEGTCLAYGNLDPQDHIWFLKLYQEYSLKRKLGISSKYSLKTKNK